MKINGVVLPTLNVFPIMMTVPDCVVVGSNKIGHGHGESKFYISSKKEMHEFYGKEGFTAKCFMLKNDLIAYMEAIKNEYIMPSQEYAKKDILPELWHERMININSLEDIIFFDIKDQCQIAGIRGYINSQDKGYQIIRNIALPLISYIYVEKIGRIDSPLYYWKLFVDFDAIWEKQHEPLVFNYGKQKNNNTSIMKNGKKVKRKNQEINRAREGQGKRRSGQEKVRANIEKNYCNNVIFVL